MSVEDLEMLLKETEKGSMKSEDGSRKMFSNHFKPIQTISNKINYGNNIPVFRKDDFSFGSDVGVLSLFLRDKTFTIITDFTFWGTMVLSLLLPL